MEVRKRTICLAIFCWDIPWKIGQKYMVGTSNKSVPEMAIDLLWTFSLKNQLSLDWRENLSRIHHGFFSIKFGVSWGSWNPTNLTLSTADRYSIAINLHPPYPLVMTNIAIENSPCGSLPEGILDLRNRNHQKKNLIDSLKCGFPMEKIKKIIFSKS